MAVELSSGVLDKTQSGLFSLVEKLLNFNTIIHIYLFQYEYFFNVSVTATSFALPPSNAKPRQPIVPDSKNYYHLESNRALLHPLGGGNLSEVRGNFTAPLSGPEECLTKRLSSLRERNDRITDNKGSHIVLGFDKPISMSEKVCLFFNANTVLHVYL